MTYSVVVNVEGQLAELTAPAELQPSLMLARAIGQRPGEGIRAVEVWAFDESGVFAGLEYQWRRR